MDGDVESAKLPRVEANDIGVISGIAVRWQPAARLLIIKTKTPGTHTVSPAFFEFNFSLG
jgi:hypothetical protein